MKILRWKGEPWGLGRSYRSQGLELESQQSRFSLSMSLISSCVSLNSFSPPIGKHSLTLGRMANSIPRITCFQVLAQNGKAILPPGPSCKILRRVLWPSVSPIPELVTVTGGKGYHDWPKPLLFQEVRGVHQNLGIKSREHDEQAQTSP